jgi:hypothetical protein
MYLNNEKKEVINNYINKSLLQKLLYVGRGLNIAEAFSEYINASYKDRDNRYSKLVNALWTKDTKHIGDIFEGKEYGALKLLLGDAQAETFRAIWNRSSDYIYSTGYYRRSYRTNKSSKLYLNKNIEKLQEFVYLAASEFSLDSYLTNNKADYGDIVVIADIIAVEVDRNNEAVVNKIKEIIYNDNNTAIVTREIIRGLLMSKNAEAHRMVGELLLAAKLQEGLRQAIVESLDEGSKEGFIYILKLIIDNNLMRFSSVARAFCTWIGLALDIEKPKVVVKCFEAAYNCLVDEGYKIECIASEHNLLIYIGTWAVAFDEVEDIAGVLNKLLSSSEKYKKLVALQFLYDTQFMIFRHQAACSILHESDLEVIALAIKNLFGDLNACSLRYREEAVKDFCKLEAHCHGIELFNKLEAIIPMITKKEIEFKGSVFPWVDFKLTIAEIIEKMILAVAMSYNSEMVDKLVDYREKMNVDTRQIFIEVFVKKPANVKQKLALIEACGDRSSSVRESAFRIVDSLELTKEDFSLVENLLQYKSGDLRKSTIKLLLKQSTEELESSVNRLMESSNENKRLAAIDIVSAIEGSKKHEDIYNKCLTSLTAMSLISQKEKLLTRNIVKNTKDYKSLENGFGLYDRTKGYEVPVIERPKNFNMSSRFSMTEKELTDILNKFSNLIHEYRDFEYETVNWDDTRVMVTLGGSNYLQPFNRDNYSLDNYPIADKIREFAKLNNLEAWKLIELDFYIEGIHAIEYRSHASWYNGLLEDNFNFKMIKKFSKAKNNIDYYQMITSYVSLLVKEIPNAERFEIGKTISVYMYDIIPPEKHYKEYLNKDNYYYSNIKDFIAASNQIEYWLRLMKNSCKDDESFMKYYYIAYNYYKANKYNAAATLTLESFGRALELRIIDENEIFKEFMERPLSPDNISAVTNFQRHDRDNLSKYPRILELGNKAADTIAHIEVKRGELNTEVSHLAARIQRCCGVSIFTSIILASEKDTYIRGYNFVSGDCTKKQMFSHLLKCCYPKEGEDAKTLGESLKGKKVTSKQLIEAAMYSPQWLDIVSEYLGYPGLKSACWYFHAHVNDFFSNEKSAIVARYTPISVEDLKDGAFDQQWFMDAYNTLGEKNFKLVYDSAKYIAGGGLHKRSQLFADATLGKLDINNVKNRVMDKRNKDYLLTYGLIPVRSKDDILERYEYIHQFIKESKQFGAQRQASEGRSASIALLNLARNAGYSDVNRLAWNMETARIHAIKAYLQPQKLEDMEVQLVIDELGHADILCTKAGKELKSIPAKFKNHEYIVKIKELKKALKDQYVRARQSFEIAMENGENFKVEELINLCENPVLAPIIKNLVFKAGESFGYINGNGLVDFNNEPYKLKEEEDVIIAHPVHLYEAGCWSNYQKDIFLKKIVQPFKQVFRELYLPNADELKERTLSRRYSGHQVQPKKTAALLKTRGWIASHEEGLQKVYYKEDIIATIYAIADWFSPADIEAPTIEFVSFEDRRTYKPVPIDKIPKLIFSEVMRDVDLVVSVAHVGGVDPEASLSTVEIRTVIVDEILKLMKLSNVVLKGTHAHITGVHGEYTVHLGSGVVHKMGTGSINILPVHSSHRGRIFLPFIDSDPKSAEIISKIILLAEDGKIKDPSVLEQIK